MHPLPKVVSKCLCPTSWSYSFHSSFPTLTNIEHMPVLMQTLLKVCALHTQLSWVLRSLSVSTAWARSQEGRNCNTGEKQKGLQPLQVWVQEKPLHIRCVLGNYVLLWKCGTGSNSEERAFFSLPRVTKPLSCGPTFSLYFQSQMWANPNMPAACPGMEALKLAPLEFTELLLCWHKSDQPQVWARRPAKLLLNTSFAW